MISPRRARLTGQMIVLKFLNFMKIELEDPSAAALDRFVDSWSSMSALFGFSPSTARVSALLIAASEPVSLGEIAERLHISRGNASMCLKELRSWGVVRRVSQPGDRRDYYEREGDLFLQTVRIARERKRREFDPVVGSAIAALEELGGEASGPQAERFSEIEDYLRTVDRAGRQLLDNEPAALALIGLLKSGYGAAKE